jgi:lipid II:glycine glycyltransferase (peptidoglycan interpeptide bridge formation enzyme)
MQEFKGSRDAWNKTIASLPDPHFLQTWEWAQVKAGYGWSPMPYLWVDGRGQAAAAAMILKRQVIRRGFAARLSVLYAPKGPLLDWMNEPLRTRVLDDLQALARSQGAIFLKIDPDVILGWGIPHSGDRSREGDGQGLVQELVRRGWRFSADQIQFRNSVLVDLSAVEAEMLARMKQKSRYNIRLAAKKGVSIRPGGEADLRALYRMYAETSMRDGFLVRAEEYYLDVWRRFMRSAEPTTLPLMAEVDGEAVAGLFLFMFAGRAYYVYGMSRDTHRDKMPTYLLQWEAIKRAKARGCTIYDLWGAPQEFHESDPMWGVYRFKAGLGGEVVRTLGAYDFAPNHLWYKLYTEIAPRVLDIMRARGRRKTGKLIGGA